MKNPLLHTDKEIADIYKRHVKTIYRVCYAYMKNSADTEDAVQETFMKLIKAGPVFQNEEHEKAWLIRTSSNICKNILRHWWRKRQNIEDCYEMSVNDRFEIDEVFQTIMSLPDKYKVVIYLYYYEGYTSVEISKILKKPPSTIRNHLHEARVILKERLGEEYL